MDEQTYQRIGKQVAERNAEIERLDTALNKCQKLGSQQSHTIAVLNGRVADMDARSQKLEAENTDMRQQVWRLTTESEQLTINVFAGHAAGMEAAAKVARETLVKHCDAAIKDDPACGACPACRLADWVDLAIAAAKDQT